MYKLEFYLDDISCLDDISMFMLNQYDTEIIKQDEGFCLEVEKIDLNPFIKILSKYIRDNFETDFDHTYEQLSKVTDDNDGHYIYNPYTNHGINELSFY